MGTAHPRIRCTSLAIQSGRGPAQTRMRAQAGRGPAQTRMRASRAVQCGGGEGSAGVLKPGG